MEKTTIYLDKEIKMHLLEMVADMSKKTWQAGCHACYLVQIN